MSSGWRRERPAFWIRPERRGRRGIFVSLTAGWTQRAFHQAQIQKHRFSEFCDLSPLFRQRILDAGRSRVDHGAVNEPQTFEPRELQREDPGTYFSQGLPKFLEARYARRVQERQNLDRPLTEHGSSDANIQPCVIVVRRRGHSAPFDHLAGEFQRTIRKIPEEGGEGGTDLDEGFPFRAGPNAGLPGLALFFSLGRLRILALHEPFPRSKRGPSIHGQTLRAEEPFHLLPIGNVLTTGPPISSLPDAPCRRTMKWVLVFSVGLACRDRGRTS